MRVLVLGANGQVGRCLTEANPPRGIDLIGVTRAEADLAQLPTLDATLAQVQPDAIINAAAYTAVDKAESERDRAFAVNATAVGYLGRWAAAFGAPVLHISTDYVFDGAGTRAYVETDAAGPLGVYGASKLAGEEALRASGAQHVILRTSWVYAAHGANFIKTMQRFGRERDEMRVVADQFGAPTAADDIAAALLEIVDRVRQTSTEARAALWGTYHYTGAGETTWHGLAEAVFEDMQRRTGRRPRCIPIATADYPTPAKRPGNSRLDCSKFDRVFGLPRSAWQESVQRTLEALARKASPGIAGADA